MVLKQIACLSTVLVKERDDLKVGFLIRNYFERVDLKMKIENFHLQITPSGSEREKIIRFFLFLSQLVNSYKSSYLCSDLSRQTYYMAF